MEEKKKTSAAQLRAKEKYEKKAYLRITTRLPRELEAKVREAAGQSLNNFIVQAVIEKLDRENK